MQTEHLLLLPGMMCDARQWQAQVDNLAVNTLVADFSSGSSIAALAANVLREAPPRFAVAGLSMGGIVAFEIWRQAQERVTHLALIDTNPFADTDERKTLRMEQIGRVLDGELRELAVDSLKPLYLAAANRNDEALLQTLLNMALDLGPDVFTEQSIALRDRPDSADTLSSIDVPTAVICGREDRLCPVSHHEFMAGRIARAELTVLEDCGHIAPMEQPAAVNALLTKLLSH